jgi:hypothetical protein
MLLVWTVYIRDNNGLVNTEFDFSMDLWCVASGKLYVIGTWVQGPWMMPKDGRFESRVFFDGLVFPR